MKVNKQEETILFTFLSLCLLSFARCPFLPFFQREPDVANETNSAYRYLDEFHLRRRSP